MNAMVEVDLLGVYGDHAIMERIADYEFGNESGEKISYHVESAGHQTFVDELSKVERYLDESDPFAKLTAAMSFDLATELALPLSFSDQITAAIVSSGLTQKAFAESLQIPLRNVEDWKAGRSTPPAWAQRLILKEAAEIAK